MAKVVVKIENVSKIYKLGQIGTGTISHDLNKFFAKLIGKEDPSSIVGSNLKSNSPKNRYVKVLDNLNFEVEKGQVLGIIGKNGAGKSTLLKLISEITKPSSGRIMYKGKIASLLEVGTGMHQEMTARENIYLNGSILGMKKIEIDRRFDDIIDFSGCSLFVDTPVKRFSSGMRVRLGFAVAAFLNPDILIVDEVLAVGDYEFQKNAVGKIKDVSQNEGRTVLFVSHNMGSIKNICNAGLVLDSGQISFLSNDISEVITHYQEKSITNNSEYSFSKRSGLGNIMLESLTLFNSLGKETKQFTTSDTIKFVLNLKNKMTKKVNIQIAIRLKGLDQSFDAMLANEYLDINITLNQGSNSVVCNLHNLPFSNSRFLVNVLIKKNQVIEDFVQNISYFEVIGGFFQKESYLYPNNYKGIYLEHDWIIM